MSESVPYLGLIPGLIQYTGMFKTQNNNRKKILYIITKSNFGGAQKYVYELAVAAKTAGHEVLVACGGTGEAGAATGHLVEKLTAADIETKHIPHFLRNMSLTDDCIAMFEVWNIVRQYKPDVLHVTSSKAGGIGALAGRLAFVPRIMFTSHGLTMDETWRPRCQQVLITCSTWLTLVLTHCSIMISTDTYTRASHMPLLKNKVALVKNGITPIRFLERGAARAKLAPHVPQRSFWIGGIGELHPNKKGQAVIQAMKTLPKSVHLVLIGEGEARKNLEQLIQQEQLIDQVHLLGYIDGATYLKAFDLFVLPSHKEGLPYVLLEAGLAGLPVVASDLPGIRDIITTGQSGLLVQPTPKLLATSLAMLVRDEGMRNKFRLTLQAHIEKEFSITTMYQQTFALYDSSKSRA